MTETEIVLETIEYYMNHARAIDVQHGGCIYLRERDGSMCGVGRCLTSEALEKAAGVLGGVNTLRRKLEFDFLDEMFQTPYHGHGLTFWNNIQVIHDNGCFWDDRQNFTEDGLHFIWENFDDETYDAVKEKFFKN